MLSGNLHPCCVEGVPCLPGKLSKTEFSIILATNISFSCLTVQLKDLRDLVISNLDQPLGKDSHTHLLLLQGQDRPQKVFTRNSMSGNQGVTSDCIQIAFCASCNEVSSSGEGEGRMGGWEMKNESLCQETLFCNRILQYKLLCR